MNSVFGVCLIPLIIFALTSILFVLVDALWDIIDSIIIYLRSKITTVATKFQLYIIIYRT